MKHIVIAALFVLGMVASATAGDYHYGTTLVCSDCHVMHFSQQHGYNSDGGGAFVALGTGPNTDLLRAPVNQLCLTCHDGQTWAPDVYGTNTGTPHNRQAGALNKVGDAGPYYPANGHTLNITSAPPGGTGWTPDATEGLTCIDCHQQHGYAGPNFAAYDSAGTGTFGTGTYRNLMYSPGNAGTTANPNRWITYRVGTNSTLKDVFERSTAGGVAGQYDVSNVDFNEPNATKSAYGAWCQGCHTNFHGSSADANMRDVTEPAGLGWFRHPTADVNIGGQSAGGHSSLTQFKNNLYRTQVMSPTGDWGTQGVAWTAAPTDLTPSCFSCHKAHGNKNAFGLIYALGSAALGEEGDGTEAKNLCRECHVQGAD